MFTLRPVAGPVEPKELLAAAVAGEGSSSGLLEALPIAIYTTDALGKINFYNKAAADLWGRKPPKGSKWCGASKLFLVTGEPLALEDSPMAVAVRERRSVRGIETILERPDGRRIPFMACPTPLFDDEGLLIGAINMLVDLSEEKRTQRSMGMFTAIVESSDDAIVSKNLDGTITSWNQGAERLFGYSVDEAIGKPITLVIPPELLGEEADFLARLKRGERIAHHETIRRRKNGTLVNVALTVSPIRAADGSIVGASKIARDISERKRSAATLARRLREQAALYRFTDRLYRTLDLDNVYDAAIEAIVDALRCNRASVLLLDESNRMTFVAWRGLSEAYRKAVEGHSPWTPDTPDPRPIVIPDVARSDLSAELKGTLAGERIGALSFIPLLIDGKLAGKFMAYYDAAHSFIPDEIELALTISRQLGFAIERFRRASAQRRADELLRESETRLEFAMVAGQMGAWEWNMGTDSVYWSPGLEAIHGMPRGSFGGTFAAFAADIHPEDRDHVLAAVERAVKTGQDYQTSYRIVLGDGSEKWLEAVGQVATAPDGSHRMTGVCMDVTRRKEAEEQREWLVAELSHRVKNTLSLVLSIARQSFATASGREAVDRFEGRIRSMGKTHTRLADARWSGVSLESMLQDELAAYSAHGSAAFRVSGPGLVLEARCALMLGMAFHELATNAAKYGALSVPDGMVEIGWTTGEGKLLIAWIESGGPPVGEPASSGFGRMLLERALASDLDSEVSLQFPAHGLQCRIVLPLARNVVG